MKLTPMDPAKGVQVQQGRSESQKTADAIKAFNSASPVQAPKSQNPTGISNPTRVSAEEMGAIIPNVPTPNIQEDDTLAQVEPQLAETPKETAPVEPKETLSSQHLALIRREKALRLKAQQQDQALKAREDALKAREEALAKQDTEYKSNYISKNLVKEDTLQVLADAGVSYDDLTQQILSQGTVDPRTQSMLKKLQQEIQELKTANENTSKQYQTQQQEARQAAIKQIRADAANLIKNDPSFETVKATGSLNDVVELIEKTFDEDGILMSVEEATQQVEDYLVEEATKLAQLSKIRQRLEPKAQSVQSQAQQPTSTPKQQQPMKTLTNQTASSRQLSAKERAILAFRGELKS